jgi:hypothetical protein
MAGKELHRWRYDYRDIPGAPPLDGPTQNTFRRAHLFPDGSLLAIYGGRGLVKLSRASELVWFYPERAHHDLALTPEGEILTLIREERQIPRVGREPLIDDYVVRLTPEGRETQRVSVLDCLLDSRFASYVRDAPVRRGDMLHTNSLELLDGAPRATCWCARASSTSSRCSTSAAARRSGRCATTGARPTTPRSRTTGTS